MLNFPISHAESLIEEEISSSQPICSLASSDSPADQSYPSFNGLGMSNQYGTWQDITIKNDQKEIIGVCGFEINSLYFKYIYKNSVSDTEHMILTIFSEKNNTYSGIISEYSATSIISAMGKFKYIQDTPFDFFRINNENYIGKTQHFSVGESNHYSAVILPYSYYKNSENKTQLLIFVIFLFITVGNYLLFYFKPSLYQPNHR